MQKEDGENFKDAAEYLAGISDYKDAAELSAKYMNAYKERAYLFGVQKMNSASSVDALKKAAEIFEKISDYKDAGELAEKCLNDKTLERKEIDRKTTLYRDAVVLMNAGTPLRLEDALRIFEDMPEWRDSREKAAVCRKKIEELKNEEVAVSKVRILRSKILIAVAIIIAALLHVLAYSYMIYYQLFYK